MRQMKYTRAEKLKIAKEHVIDGISLHELSEKYHYSTSIIKYQTQLYIRHGEAIFAESLDRSYTREEKLHVIECIANGESAHSIALEMGMRNPTIIRDWIKKYKRDGIESIKNTHSREANKHHDDKILEKEYKKAP